MQSQEVNFEEVFTLVARLESVRLTFPSLFFFNLNTNFKPMGLCLNDKLVSVHVLYLSMASSSFCMASCHIVSVAA